MTLKAFVIRRSKWIAGDYQDGSKQVEVPPQSLESSFRADIKSNEFDTVYAFDCDGTLECGDGPISVETLHKLSENAYVVIVAPSPKCQCSDLDDFPNISDDTFHEDSDRDVRAKNRIKNLERVKEKYQNCSEFIYVADNDGDEKVAEEAGFKFLFPTKKFNSSLSAQDEGDSLLTWVTINGQHVLLADSEARDTINGIRHQYVAPKNAVKKIVASMIIKPDEKLRSRIKGIDSIIGKMKKKGLSTPDDIKSRIQDIAGIRVVVLSLDRQQELHSDIRQAFQGHILTEDNYVDNPKDSYRAIHVTVEQDGKPVEIQIKTANQQKFSDFVRKNSLYKGATAKTRHQDPVVTSYLKNYSNYLYNQDLGIKSNKPRLPKGLKASLFKDLNTSEDKI